MAALALALGAFAAPPASASTPARTHVYLFNGIFGLVFSTGVTEIADNLRADGFHASVYGPSLWPEVARAAAADYRKGQIDTIVLVGYSAGTEAVNHVVARLSKEGIPVKLAIGLDPLHPDFLLGKVDRYINFYNPRDAGRPISGGDRFTGVIQNVNLSNVPGLNHVNIDDNATVQARVVTAIRAAR